MDIKANYFNGKSSVRQAATLRLRDGRLLLECPAGESSWLISEVKLSAPLASLGRTIYLPDGGTCEIPDGDFARRLEGESGSVGRGIHRWENSLKLAALALLLTVGVVWGGLQYGIPYLSQKAADAMPPETETLLGHEALGLLDRSLFTPSELPEARRSEVMGVFDVVTATLDADRDYRLVFRSSPRLGANALALPGGVVVVTDQFVELASDERELAAVLAHEVGHVKGRHLLRRTFQSMGAGLVVASLTGDLSSVSALAATLPTVLVETKFSRDMEREADDVAAEYLRGQGLSAEPLVAILEKLQAAHAPNEAGDADSGSSLTDYLSTHPGTQERIQRLKEE